MKNLTKILVVGLLAVSLSGWLMAADNHQVTVEVQEVNLIDVTGGNLTLTISGSFDDVVDNTTCDLTWSTNGSSKKITVGTDQASPTFTLKVVGLNASGGTAASEVTLNSTTAQDFITSVTTGTGSADLQYTASATASQGTGSDVHTVTYTITAS